MSNLSYIEKSIDDIMTEEGFPFPKNLAMTSAWILGNLKGINLKILEVKELSSLADYFILASATNTIQAKAMASEIARQMNRLGYQPLSQEGIQTNADWILMDIGDVIVHIFLETSRAVYDLDGLWREANSIEIPQDYYFSDVPETAEESKDSSRSYF
ncbi:MAG: ribosome silencing factor [Halobacteriovoraceae bacterium]|jgi:ribosome-associated protein|nr:ribosome silencing factor [Halobacteriovoraceae bacterium]MBT5092711.1 ribosome silencing factor [Halobacteriovoraceae bacterium]